MRLFVACDLPEAVKAALELRLLSLRGQISNVSWMRPDALHVTLAFIGDQPEGSVATINKALGQEFDGTANFNIHIEGGGMFPNQRRARVGWVALLPPEPLNALADKARRALEGSSVGFDNKPFRAHVTLARFRDHIRPDQAQRFLDHFHDFRSEQFFVDRVTLYSSTLSSRGATHTPLATVMLGKTNI